MTNIITTDPKVFGPGMWMTLHILGYNSNDLSKAKQFSYTIKSIIEKLPCKKCRNHAIQFINKTKYSNYINQKNRQGLYIGPFIYICDMHNNANNLLNKPIISWRESYAIYDNLENICSDGPCTDDNDISNNIIRKIDGPLPKVNLIKDGRIIDSTY